ncbi:MAG: hypothetical protein J6R13_07395 [Alistipes sp.]|nr:hypothetical protein [Alistipes sp.]
MKRIIAVVAIVAAVTVMAQTPDSFEQFRRQMDSSFESVKKSNNESFERRRAEIDRQYADHIRNAWAAYNSSPSVPEPERPEPVVIPKYEPKAPTSTEHPVTVVTSVPKPQPVKPVVEPKSEPKSPVVVSKPTPQPAPAPAPAPAPKSPVVAPKPTPAAPVVAPKPEPKAPVAEPKSEPKAEPKAPVAVSKPEPVVPATSAPSAVTTTPTTPVVPATPAQRTTDFLYYGTQLSIRVPEVGVPSLFTLTENSIADAWIAISSGDFEQTLADCLEARKSLMLGDWRYYTLVREFTKQYYEADCNDGVLLQAYLLAHSGYRIRMARSGNFLHLLLDISGTVYNMSYFVLDGVRFYRPEKRNDATRMYICEVKFPGEQSLSLQQPTPPQLAYKPMPSKSFVSKRYPEAKVGVTLNKNIIDFYSNYPSTDFAFYVHTSLSTDLKRQLYPMLRGVTAGKSQHDAVSVILNFVQTAFEYKTDDQQFGREKWYFGDEIFYYPHSDCDDRAILFSTLVRDILKMDAVLLDYPGHLAAAVRFDGAVNGDYVVVEGKRFVICDPTYVGAGVGASMPDLDTSNLKIIKL